jgi:hypothetical protein
MSKPTYKEAINTPGVERAVAASLLSGKDKDGNDFKLPVEMVEGGGVTQVEGFPENEEVVALTSATDTTGGRTSADIVNKYGRGIALLVEVTAGNGGDDVGDGDFALQAEFGIEAKNGSGYSNFAYAIRPITTTGEYPQRFLFFFHPELSASPYADGVEQTPVLRTYRVKTSCATDGAGNNLTYSIRVVHLL